MEGVFKKRTIFPKQILEKSYKNLTNEQIQFYLKLYRNSKVITMNLEDLLLEEK